MTKSNFLPLSLTCSKETIECTLEPVHCKALTEKKIVNIILLEK